MDPFKMANKLGQVASSIAKHGKLEAAAVVTINGKQIGMFFGSEGNIDTAKMADILKGIGEYTTRLGADIASGKIKPELMDEDGTQHLNPEEPTKPNNPWGIN